GTMRITICTFGSRGDTQPYLALALGLQQAGHQVMLVASPEHTGWIRSYGIEVYPLRFSLQAFAQQPDKKHALKGRNLLRILREFRSGFETYLAGVMDDCWNAAQEAEYLVLSSITTMGVDIASRRGIPVALVSLGPIFPPTRA